MADPIERAIEASSPHELIVQFLARECSVTPEQYDALYIRMVEWANAYEHKACVNTFNPIMLLEQVRREFDPSVDFVTFAMVAADLQWGPRMMKIAEHDDPVWILALTGFPRLIEEAKAKIANQT